MNEDSVSIIPNDQIQALLTAILAGDTVHEPLELILTDDAESYMRKCNFMRAMGLKDSSMANAFKQLKRAGALQRAIAAENIYLKMRMIEHPDLQLEYYNAAAGSTEPAPTTTTNDTAGGAADGTLNP